jgi:hypothetical protein
MLTIVVSHGRTQQSQQLDVPELFALSVVSLGNGDFEFLGALDQSPQFGEEPAS